MKTIAVRTTMVFTALAMALVAWSGVASAQDYTPTNPVADQVAYGGPFPSGLAVSPVLGSLGFDSISATPGTGAAAGGVVGGTGGGLAVTGSDVDLPVVAAISLIGAGGVILVAARRREI